ncbi:MAG: glycosyltransferase [Candidatus Omnitrophica bacterium]|nr:glycosyltransferase [Candidatus Omnitrophota bacterium]
MKVALVHDWLITMRGGERVLEAMTEVYPDSPIYTLFYRRRALSSRLRKKKIHASFLQYFPFIRFYYRFLLPIFPFAIRTLKPKGFDVVISISHCAAKGIRIEKGTLHICYCNAPMRYAWGFHEEYLEGKWYKNTALWLLGFLRRWDFASSKGVDHFIGNSSEIKKRIRKYYRRDAAAIFPPVNLRHFRIADKTDDYYLVVSALVPYKRIDLAIKAFNELKRPLLIVGEGPLEKTLKAMAGPTVRFAGAARDAVLRQYYSHCRAMIVPMREDFGIVSLEAQSSGRPVIAYGRGGSCDTVVDISREREAGYSTGVYFEPQSVSSLIEAVKRFEKIKWHPGVIRRHALMFDKEVFKNRIRSYVLESYRRWVKLRA